MPIKIDRRQILEKQAEIGRLNKYVEDNEIIIKEKGGALWKMLGPKIQAAAESAKLDAISLVAAGEDRKAAIAVGHHQAYSAMFNLVDKVGVNIEGAREKMSLLRQAIKRAQGTGGVID